MVPGRLKPAVLLLLVATPCIAVALTEVAPEATAYVSETPTGNSTTLLKASTVCSAVLLVHARAVVKFHTISAAVVARVMQPGSC